MRSSVDTLPVALVISPFAILCGVTTKVTQKYRPVTLLGWVLSMIGMGLLTLLRPTTPMGQLVGFQFVMAAGVGIVVSDVYS